jgi:Cu(I)/Ag(I) efflux system membrane protein CusA/SilA
LEAQEGRLISPLAYTKTYAMAVAAGLAVTLIPVLMGYLIRGRIPEERKNPLNRFLIAIYRPALNAVLRTPMLTIALALAIVVATLWPASRIGGEFMPPLDEGDLLYMPSALPGISAGKVAELLQQTDRLIKTVPEVASVFAKAGRAETATDPAPLEMFETTIQFKPREQWRAGMTPEKLVEELDRIVKVPGLSNIWVPPIRNRIDMLATGIKSPVGVKVAGTNLQEVDRIGAEVERVVKRVPGVTSAFAERLTGGRYIDVQIDRATAGRYGLNVSDVQSVVSAAIGGDNIGETIEGLQRFPINVRYPREIRDSVEMIRDLPVLTDRGAQIRLRDVAAIRISDGPPMLKSENARLSGWVYIDLHGRDLSSAVRDMQSAVAQEVKLPAGYSISWSGQFEFLERATQKLKIVVPATLVIIFVLLYLIFRSFPDALLIMATLPFALVGGFWLMYLLGYNMSVASAVGFIALGGVASEIGVVMLVYINQAITARTADGKLNNQSELIEGIVEGAALRVRPVAITVAVIIAGLLPIMWGSGTGSEVMRRIAAPMVGGMITAPLLSMFVIPAAYLLIRRAKSRGKSSAAQSVAAASA